MGTRNLTCVVLGGEYKIAKYGQWDGYREGLGTEILNFLRDDFNREKFLAGLSKVKTITDAHLKQLWAEVGADPNSYLVTMEVSDKFKSVHPELSRDISGADLLKAIQTGNVEWSHPDVNFAADSLFCEWVYVIDLDKNTFEIYEGFNTTPLNATERFAFLPTENSKGSTEYYPVRLLKSYSLRRLPLARTMCKVTSLSRRKDLAKKKTAVFS